MLLRGLCLSHSAPFNRTSSNLQTAGGARDVALNLGLSSRTLEARAPPISALLCRGVTNSVHSTVIPWFPIGCQERHAFAPAPTPWWYGDSGRRRPRWRPLRRLGKFFPARSRLSFFWLSCFCWLKPRLLTSPLLSVTTTSPVPGRWGSWGDIEGGKIFRTREKKMGWTAGLKPYVPFLYGFSRPLARLSVQSCSHRICDLVDWTTYY